MTERTQEQTEFSRRNSDGIVNDKARIHDIREVGGSVEGTDSDTTG
jgi:hypothetical protein